MGAAGPEENVGIPEGAFWAPQQGMGAAVAHDGALWGLREVETWVLLGKV